MLRTVIAKPTRECNADCSYCCAPPDGAGRWSLEDFKLYFDKLLPQLDNQVEWIWHGGEAMLMGAEFFQRTQDYATKRLPGVRFGMQSNLLAYKSSVWKVIFDQTFEGRISTSFDPGPGSHRLLKGSADRYEKRFFSALESIMEDGFTPLIIGTYSESTAEYAHSMYEFSLSQSRPVHLRFNYRYPAGRLDGGVPTIDPLTYGNMLISLYDRWIYDCPDFVIIPLYQMLQKVLDVNLSQCPWTKSCGGHFVGIEPNGDVFNCGEFADLNDPAYCFGNLVTDDLDTLFASPAATAIRRRRVSIPAECITCRHHAECEGGCARDAVLFGNSISGKFFYCDAWKAVFDRIKASIHNGEAKGIIDKYTNFNIQEVRIAC